MEIQEAIDTLKERVQLIKKDYKREATDYLEVLEMAISALEKQIAKTPGYEGKCYYDGELTYDKWICPNCGEEYNLEDDYHNYCPECGQRILHEVPRTDWWCD